MKKQINKKKIALYSNFLLFIWNKTYSKYVNSKYQQTATFDSASTYDFVADKYYQLFFMINKKGNTHYEAVQLIKWLDSYNNGKLPDNLQIMFNEFLLERI